MKLSKRMQDVSVSATMDVTNRAAEMIKAGIDVISLSAGEPDFDTPEFVKKAASDAISAGRTKYTAVEGILDLRLAIARRYTERLGVPYQADEVIVSTGAKQAIFNALFAIIDAGDEVIIPAPYWVSYPEQVRLAGGKPVIVETCESDAFKLTPSQLTSALTARTKIVVLNSPSNPTGEVYTRAELAALAEVIQKRLWVLSDDIYEDLVYEGSFCNLIHTDPLLEDRVVVISGVSKSFAMTGFRIGYALGPAPLVRAMKVIQSHTTSNPSTPCQYAALAALSAKGDVIAPMRQAFKERRDLLYRGISEIPGLRCRKPLGAFYLFPNVETYFGKRWRGGPIQSASDVARYLLEEAKVAVVPGEGFGSSRHIRISYAASVAQIQEGVRRIQGAFGNLQ